MDEVKVHLEKNAVEKIKKSISESTLLLTNGQTLILLTDKSEFGQKTVEKYSQYQLAESEDDGKKILRTEDRAEKALKFLPPERRLGNFPQLSTL